MSYQTPSFFATCDLQSSAVFFTPCMKNRSSYVCVQRNDRSFSRLHFLPRAGSGGNSVFMFVVLVPDLPVSFRSCCGVLLLMRTRAFFSAKLSRHYPYLILCLMNRSCLCSQRSDRSHPSSVLGLCRQASPGVVVGPDSLGNEVCLFYLPWCKDSFIVFHHDSKSTVYDTMMTDGPVRFHNASFLKFRSVRLL